MVPYEVDVIEEHRGTGSDMPGEPLSHLEQRIKECRELTDSIERERCLLYPLLHA